MAEQPATTTFHLIRYNRTYWASDMFPHIAKNDPHDYEITIAGTYQGRKHPKARFSEALFMTAKQADKLIRKLIDERIPADIIEHLTVEVAEPA